MARYIQMVGFTPRDVSGYVGSQRAIWLNAEHSNAEHLYTQVMLLLWVPSTRAGCSFRPYPGRDDVDTYHHLVFGLFTVHRAL